MKTTLVTLALAAGSASAFVGGFMPKNSVAPTAARSHSSTTMFLNFGKKAAAAPAKAAPAKAPAKGKVVPSIGKKVRAAPPPARLPACPPVRVMHAG